MDQSAYVRETMCPLLPMETSMTPKLPKIDGIQAVVFDIYGTLLISAAGDTLSDLPASIQTDFDTSFPGIFRAAVSQHQARARERGIAFPEVEIREVWAELVESLGLSLPADGGVETLALRYECAVNPVWPMLHSGEAIERLRRVGLKLGILSNSQFYTLPIIEGLFGAALDVLGFDAALQVFSFEEREGKPSPRLFEILAKRAKDLGIDEEQIFYLGNDMIKDILPAREIGFRTGLFAGDARSLRLGKYSAEEAAEIADAVITDLAQLPAILNTII